MKKKWILSVLILSLFLCPPLAYCQELTSNELKIFYDAAEYEINIAEQVLAGNDVSLDSLPGEFASRYGLTDEGVRDLVDRGERMPLTSTEEQVARELRERLSNPNGEEMYSADNIRVMKELANKYGMPLGQVGSIIVRMDSDFLDE